MKLIFALSFSGFSHFSEAQLTFGKLRLADGLMYRTLSCSISLPYAVFDSVQSAEVTANSIIDQLIGVKESLNDLADEPINLIGVSESCGLIRLLLTTSRVIDINVIVVSACLDRARTPFGNRFSCPGVSQLSSYCTPYWFDWRRLDFREHHHILLCHGTKDLNPSTPFIDAWSFFLRSSSAGKDVTLLQVAGMLHGYQCISSSDVHQRINMWLDERCNNQ